MLQLSQRYQMVAQRYQMVAHRNHINTSFYCVITLNANAN